MAKSLRSKWRRQCRAVKRERNGRKELDRLQKMIAEKRPVALKNICRVVKGKLNTEDMDVDPKVAENRVFDPKTKQDKNGNYPIWMKRKELQKIKQQNRRIKMKHKKKKKQQ